MKQYYKVVKTGQWCEPSYENGGADAGVVAETLGLGAGEVVLVEAEDDPRKGELLPDPNQTPMAPVTTAKTPAYDELVARVEALEDKV